MLCGTGLDRDCDAIRGSPRGLRERAPTRCGFCRNRWLYFSRLRRLHGLSIGFVGMYEVGWSRRAFLRVQLRIPRQCRNFIDLYQCGRNFVDRRRRTGGLRQADFLLLRIAGIGHRLGKSFFERHQTASQRPVGASRGRRPRGHHTYSLKERDRRRGVDVLRRLTPQRQVALQPPAVPHVFSKLSLQHGQPKLNPSCASSRDSIAAPLSSALNCGPVHFTG